MISQLVNTDIKVRLIQSFEELNKAFIATPQISLEHRLKRLSALENHLQKNSEKIAAAVQKDFNKPGFESDTSELLTTLVELRKAKKELRSWTRPKKVATPTELSGTSHYIRYEPKGVVLIISPWNYPVNLSLIPLIAAWSAGNRIILKPSEYTTYTSQLLNELICEIFSSDEIQVIQGDGAVADQLCRLPFNHLFFTGSATTAKKIMQAAVENLTPLTLELGGKSPVIIDSNVDLKNIIPDIAYAKTLNAGQSCISPDFILLPKQMKDAFVMEWNQCIEKMYGTDPANNPDYCGLIHAKHYQRILKMIYESVDAGAQLTESIQHNEKTGKIKPVLLLNTQWNHASMQEEIFGPVLPVICYQTIEEVISQLNANPRPLALYLFSKNQQWSNTMLNKLRSGGVTINNCLLNFCNFNLPFGGDHHSGSGFNHGRYGFETFSHQRAVSVQGKLLNPLRFFYPPFTKTKIRIKNIALKILGKI
jgi:aldehyde dehydrogenase (NAD+)